jgi:hypothetical protein
LRAQAAGGFDSPGARASTIARRRGEESSAVGSEELRHALEKTSASVLALFGPHPREERIQGEVTAAGGHCVHGDLGLDRTLERAQSGAEGG